MTLDYFYGHCSHSIPVRFCSHSLTFIDKKSNRRGWDVLKTVIIHKLWIKLCQQWDYLTLWICVVGRWPRSPKDVHPFAQIFPQTTFWPLLKYRYFQTKKLKPQQVVCWLKNLPQHSTLWLGCHTNYIVQQMLFIAFDRELIIEELSFVCATFDSTFSLSTTSQHDWIRVRTK